MGRKVLLGAMLVAGIGVVAIMLELATGKRNSAPSSAAYAVPGLPDMTVQAAHGAFHRVTPALLLVVYEAFALVEEDEIYDTLAAVTDGGALEYLYLERRGAMSDGGLEEADQEIHEISLVNATVERDGGTLAVGAVWQVIGTVGHAEHLHVRGNTYSADLTVAPVDGAWKITDFSLLDVDRNAAGETFLAPDTN